MARHQYIAAVFTLGALLAVTLTSWEFSALQKDKANAHAEVATLKAELEDAKASVAADRKDEENAGNSWLVKEKHHVGQAKKAEIQAPQLQQVEDDKMTSVPASSKLLYGADGLSRTVQTSAIAGVLKSTPAKTNKPIASVQPERSIVGIAQVAAHLPPLTNKCAVKKLNLAYFKKLNLVFCTCAKCGSTSAFTTLFKRIFHHDHQTNKVWKPYIHYWDPQWKDERIDFGSWAAAKKVLGAKKVESLALVRDPYARLVSSWKSKYACEGSDSDHTKKVPELLRLAGVPRRRWKRCLTLTDFAMVVQKVYLKGDACRLNVHVKPQSMDCFAEIAPQNYTVVSTASQLSELHPAAFGEMSHLHASGRKSASYVHPTTEAVLRQLADLEEWTQHVQW